MAFLDLADQLGELFSDVRVELGDGAYGPAHPGDAYAYRDVDRSLRVEGESSVRGSLGVRYEDPATAFLRAHRRSGKGDPWWARVKAEGGERLERRRAYKRAKQAERRLREKAARAAQGRPVRAYRRRKGAEVPRGVPARPRGRGRGCSGCGATDHDARTCENLR